MSLSENRLNDALTASLHRLGAGSAAGLYYTNDSVREARPDKRDEYYLSDGGGRWFSTGQTIVRHDAVVDAGSFRDLCAGRNPRDGSNLVRGAGEGHWAGLDLTMTPGKSVSVLWAAGNADQQAIIERAHRNAVDRALRFLVDEGLVLVRSGAGGRNRHKPDDLIVAKFDHFTTRDGDPNLHTHCVVINVAGAPAAARSGRYRARHLTIEPHDVFVWKRAIGAAYRAELAKGLREAFDLAFRPAGKGQWEVAGIPQFVLDRFSKRSAAITEHAGANASPAQREVAALATRRGKDEVPTGLALQALWREAFDDLGVDPWTHALKRDVQLAQDRERLVEREQAFDPPEIVGKTPVALAATALFAHESVLERKPLLQLALEEAGLQGVGADAVIDELAEHEYSGVLLPLKRSNRTLCWTTTQIAATEASMLRAASRLDERDWFLPEAVEAALAEAPHLAPEQAAAVLEAVGRDGVSLLEAGAGTGKTTTMSAVVSAARRSGLSVLGLAPSWVAADELGKATGIEAAAIARWRHDVQSDKGQALDAKTIVLVDEAGMVSTRDMEAVLSAAHRANAKVLLVGDRRQLASIAGASALRAVSDVVERSSVLQEVRRQQVEWQQAASTLMARGDAESGLRAYASRGSVELVAGDVQAFDRTMAAWREERAAHGDDVLIITRRNRDAAILNASARTMLRGEDKLGPDLITLPSLNRNDAKTQLALATGDLIRFGETLPHLALRNGNRARVEAITPSADGTDARLRLRLESGHVIEEPMSRLSREPTFGRKRTLPRLVHAYAGTAYAAQGRTCEAAIIHIAQATDAREIYVALTRHRQNARVVVERERLDARCRVRQADVRQHPTTTAMLEELFREARQYSEKTNVVDHVADRIKFRESGEIELVEPAYLLDVLRVVRAARAIQEELKKTVTSTLVLPVWRLLDSLGRRMFWSTKDQVRRTAASMTLRLSTRTRGPDPSNFGPER